jgi:hypothetical protein
MLIISGLGLNKRVIKNRGLINFKRVKGRN